jgi:hypothetical protein
MHTGLSFIVAFYRAPVVNAIAIQHGVILHLKRRLLQSNWQSWLHKIACCGDYQQQSLDVRP